MKNQLSSIKLVDGKKEHAAERPHVDEANVTDSSRTEELLHVRSVGGARRRTANFGHVSTSPDETDM
jgi:hypothetical protein